MVTQLGFSFHMLFIFLKKIPLSIINDNMDKSWGKVMKNQKKIQAGIFKKMVPFEVIG